jgi:hypothetical protein
MATIQCPGEVATSATGEALCLDGTGTPLAWVVVPDFSIDQLDPLMLSEAFAAGFIIIGTCWAIGKGAALVIQAIKRL